MCVIIYICLYYICIYDYIFIYMIIFLIWLYIYDYKYICDYIYTVLYDLFIWLYMHPNVYILCNIYNILTQDLVPFPGQPQPVGVATGQPLVTTSWQHLERRQRWPSGGRFEVLAPLTENQRIADPKRRKWKGNCKCQVPKSVNFKFSKYLKCCRRKFRFQTPPSLQPP